MYAALSVLGLRIMNDNMLKITNVLNFQSLNSKIKNMFSKFI